MSCKEEGHVYHKETHKCLFCGEPIYQCWLSDWFMASRNDAKEYHCSKLGFSEQCGYCANRDNIAIGFIHVVKEE